MRVKLLILCIISLFGCKEEFLLESINYKPTLVVEGTITNEPGPYIIKISNSSPITDGKMIPHENCIVILYENTNYSEQLTEIEPGLYSTSEDGLQGKIGNEYKITIVTPEGNEYECQYQKLPEPVGIDSLFPKLIYQESLSYPLGLPGYQFYINTKKSNSLENYFLWDLTETYQYTAEYIVVDFINLENATPEDYYKYYRCWKTQKIKNLYTGKTSNLVVPQIVEHPLHFVSTNTRRLQERYSLLLKQYSINKETYSYYKNIENLFSSENFLSTSQPYNVIGNIKNSKNESELVFGNFTVASVIQKRIYVNAPNVPFYFEKCGIGFDLIELKRRSTPVYLVIAENGLMGGVAEPCINCTFEGGVIEKPDFWIDF